MFILNQQALINVKCKYVQKFWVSRHFNVLTKHIQMAQSVNVIYIYRLDYYNRLWVHFTFEISWLDLWKFHLGAVHQTCHFVDLAEWKNIFWCQKFQENQDLISDRVFLCLGPSVRRVTDGENASEIWGQIFVLNYTRAPASLGLLQRLASCGPGLVKCPNIRQNKHHSFGNIQPSFFPEV